MTWQFLLGNNYPDLNNTDGTIYFASGQMSSSFNVIIVNDGIPSLDHLYTLQLTNTTKVKSMSIILNLNFVSICCVKVFLD